eukprot:5230000-Pyramimonas_sp.AAC.2
MSSIRLTRARAAHREEAVHDGGTAGALLCEGLVGVAGAARGHDEVGDVTDPRLKPCRTVHRVQGGAAHLTLKQGVPQRIFVHQLPAGCVH